MDHIWILHDLALGICRFYKQTIPRTLLVTRLQVRSAHPPRLSAVTSTCLETCRIVRSV